MKISVVIPLYNKHDSILRALQSISNQTILPYEIIVVNDGSTDGSDQLVEVLHNHLIRLIEQPNAGVSAARNKGIEEAKGDWIAFLDADDEWKPAYLETMQKLVFLYPQCSILGSAYEMQDHLGNRKSIILKKILLTGEKGILSNYFDVASCSHPPLWTSAVMVRKDVIQNIGGFPEEIKSGEDLLTWARLAAKYEIAYSLQPLSVFIQDAAHTYEDKPNRDPDPDDRVGNELLKLLKEVKQEQKKGFCNYISLWYKMRASIYLRFGVFLPALKQCFRALKYQPLNKIIYIYILIVFLPVRYRLMIFKHFSS